MKRIEVNISGEVFVTYDRTLKRFPRTLLGNPKARQRYFCPYSNQYYLDRSRLCFEAILSFYQQGGNLQCPKDIDIHIFEKECRFYQLPEENVNKMKLLAGILPELVYPAEVETKCKRRMTRRERLWDVLENPSSSTVATIYTLVSFTFIILAILLVIIESVKYIKFPWDYAELALNTFFIAELVIRYICAPEKLPFIFDWLNLIDIAAISSYFIILIFVPENVKSVGYLRIVRLIRVLRLLKLSKHSRRLQVVTLIVKMCCKEFAFLLFTVSLLVVLAASVMFYIEENTASFLSIPHGFWWGIITLTTVGYGDTYPVSYLGRIVAGFVMVFGALTLSIPILAIISNFERFYEKNLGHQTIEPHRKESTEERGKKISHANFERFFEKNLGHQAIEQHPKESSEDRGRKIGHASFH